ncbi:hypothetical protein [Jeotgalibaca caeni]|uniref:hypothetical protein n=1 Tax=Jeotgalibaca caeni TaxID=3028623 RepID=UPI00237D4A0A|nr:hypothetical protein [Jeotgalibaca caeni]MDE1547840.1 hypothetical protein [Jeotgalibaca caeni]
MKKNQRANRGAILPVVMVVVVIAQLTLYGIQRVYQSQMETYILLNHHYQSQTIIAMAEKSFHNNSELRTFTFTIGTVTVQKKDKEHFLFKSSLHSGYKEDKMVISKHDEKKE